MFDKIKNNILPFMCGVLCIYLINSIQIEPIKTEIKNETKVQTKTKTTAKANSKCRAVVTTKPDGTTSVSVESNSKSSTSTKTNTNNSTKVSQPLGSSKHFYLGVRYYHPLNMPISVSKEQIGVVIGIPTSNHFSVEFGYRLDKTISIGVNYVF